MHIQYIRKQLSVRIFQTNVVEISNERIQTLDSKCHPPSASKVGQNSVSLSQLITDGPAVAIQVHQAKLRWWCQLSSTFLIAELSASNIPWILASHSLALQASHSRLLRLSYFYAVFKSQLPISFLIPFVSSVNLLFFVRG